MNKISGGVIRRHIFALSGRNILKFSTTAARCSSPHPLPPSNQHNLVKNRPAASISATLESSISNSTDFTTLRDIIVNPGTQTGPELEDVLDHTGIVPNEALLLEIFNHSDTSPKPLFTLFMWAEKQPGFEFSVSVFNAMINALGKARKFDRALDLIVHRLNGNERPDLDSFIIIIRHYIRAGLCLPAIRTYEFASTLDFLQVVVSETNLLEILLDSLSKEGHVRDASNYFDERRARDTSWVPSTRMYNILLNGWFRSWKLEQAEILWKEMKKEKVKPTIETYGTLVEGLCSMRRVEFAVALIWEMKEKGIEPNAIIYNPVIDALVEAGRFKDALGMMERLSILESGPTISTYHSLIKGYCKAGDIQEASKILKVMINRGIMPIPTTYNYFFRYFSEHNKIEDGLNLYKKIMASGYEPDRLTYHLLVKMLCEQGRLQLSMQFVKEMRSKGCDLDLATSKMLIYLMIKMQKFDKAIDEFRHMIRRGLVPRYPTYRKMSNELKIQGRLDLAQKLSCMMTSIPHSKNLSDTYGISSHYRNASILQKAEAVSDILKTTNDRRILKKLTNSPEDAVSSADNLTNSIMKRVQMIQNHCHCAYKFKGSI